MVEISEISDSSASEQAQGNVLSSIASSTTAAFAAQQQVLIDDESLKQMIAAVDTKVLRKATRRVPYPLQFQPEKTEINFHCIYYMLRFGASFEQELEKRSGQTLSDALTFGMIGAFTGAVLIRCQPRVHSLRTLLGPQGRTSAELS
jgi:hypothetical protein